MPVGTRCARVCGQRSECRAPLVYRERHTWRQRHRTRSPPGERTSSNRDSDKEERGGGRGGFPYARWPTFIVLAAWKDSSASRNHSDLRLNNTTTASALLRLLEAIAKGEAVDPESSHQMLAILERQTVADRIPAGLPPGMRVAHKTGEITGIRHDAPIVFAARPFVLVVLTRGAISPEAGSALIAEITRQLYHATQ